jgi:hypothetical protein
MLTNSLRRATRVWKACAILIATAARPQNIHFDKRLGGRHPFHVSNSEQTGPRRIPDTFGGSDREFDGRAILRSFLYPVDGEEFDVGHRHPLSLQ